MPIFGKHKNTDTARHGRHHDDYNTTAADLDRQREHATVSELYGTNDHHDGRYPTQGLDAPTAPYQGGPNDPYANAHQQPRGGPGSDLGATGPNPQVPPASHINPSTNTRTGGGGGNRLTGKAERAVGSLVGSQALKEKGFQKEHEAGAFKMQSAEIAEAERLEKEALMRRERAVAHGAHPDNRHLGGLQNANTLSDVTQTGHGDAYGAQVQGRY